MTQRERLLALAVGGLFFAVIVQWGFTKYRTALRARNTALTSLQNQQERMNEEILQGAYADRQMGEYLARSLPSTPERAQSDYQRWLLGLVETNQLADAIVDPTGSAPAGDLYQIYSFRVIGRATLQQLTDILYGFYAKDYLHRIRAISTRPARTGGMSLELTVDAIALRAAQPDAKGPGDTSWRVSQSKEAYRDQILNRNFFSPPNQAPKYVGSNLIEAFVGAESKAELKFEDPEGHNIDYAILGDAPAFVQLDPSSGRLAVDAKEVGKYELLIRVTDKGFPQQTIEQPVTLEVKVPPEPPKPAPDFDDASQTVLTGLVQGRDEWMAWMHIRTRDETLKLRVGDSFVVGTVKGKIIEVNQRFVQVEVDGRRFTLRPSESLADGYKKSLED